MKHSLKDLEKAATAKETARANWVRTETQRDLSNYVIGRAMRSIREGDADDFDIALVAAFHEEVGHG